MPTKTYAHPSDVTRSQAFQVAKPTAWTVYTRAFLPWQLWRFVWINFKMIEIILDSHRTHLAPPGPSGSGPIHPDS